VPALEKRSDVIQALLDHTRARVYLEVGVKAGKTFLALRAPLKLGVDPVFTGKAKKRARSPLQLLNRGPATGALFGWRLFRMTSDEFFVRHAALLRQRGIDVAFVDGLHSYRQSLADVYHCLEYLRPGGVIAIDDCNPPTLACGTSPREEAEKLPGYTGDWCGDVYRTVIDLRTRRKDLEVFTLDCAFGIAIVTQRPGYAHAPIPERDVEAGYGDLERERVRLLDLRPPESLAGFLSARAR
jgi:hypothetical protein